VTDYLISSKLAGHTMQIVFSFCRYAHALWSFLFKIKSKIIHNPLEFLTLFTRH